MLEHCLTEVSPWYIRIMEKIIWTHADKYGSTKVLTWVLENRPDILERHISSMRGAATATVKWCIANLMVSSPAPVDWAMMKVEAIWYKNTEFEKLLDWVVLPPCPFPGLCGDCPSCMIIAGDQHPKYIYRF